MSCRNLAKTPRCHVNDTAVFSFFVRGVVHTIPRTLFDDSTEWLERSEMVWK